MQPFDLDADLDAIEREDVPAFLIGIYTTYEWRQMRAINTLGWYMPVGEENVRRYNELYAKFELAATPEIVRSIETKLQESAEVSWAEMQVMGAAQKASQPRTNSERAWDEWYQQPVWESLSRYIPERFEARRLCAPRARRGRRVLPRRRARAPARRDDPDPEPSLRVIPISAFRAEVQRALRRGDAA